MRSSIDSQESQRDSNAAPASGCLGALLRHVLTSLLIPRHEPEEPTEPNGPVGPEVDDDWWLTHLGEMADHYRRLYERHELRARYVLVVLAVGLAAARLVIAPSQIDFSSAEKVVLNLWLLFLGASAATLLAVLAPLRGARFFMGSLEGVIHQRVLSRGIVGKLLRGLLGGRDLVKLTPYPLSQEFRKACGDRDAYSIEARSYLKRYLEQEFRTDLEWWISGSSGAPISQELYDIRRRQIFWFWANKEASNRKAVILEISISVLVRSALLCGAALSVISLVDNLR